MKAFAMFVYLLHRIIIPIITNAQNSFFKKKWANPGLFLFIFVLFSLQFQYKLKKAKMVCLGIEPGATGW